jgi:hypothetical protein
MGLCWPLQMPPTAKAVLMSLADNANDHGECWPSINTISQRTCFGRTAVIEAIQWLESVGRLKADRANGRHTKYQISLERELFEAEKPVRDADQSAKRTGSPNGPNQSVSRTGPVRQADSNRKEPSRTVNKNTTAAEPDFSAWPSKPSDQVFADWQQLRKRKRADVTATVMREMGKQLHLAAAKGYSVDDALTECCNRGWQGLKAEWLDDTRAGNHERTNGGGSRRLSAVERVEANVEARRREREQRPPIQGEVIR